MAIQVNGDVDVDVGGGGEDLLNERLVVPSLLDTQTWLFGEVRERERQAGSLAKVIRRADIIETLPWRHCPGC